MEKNIFYKLSVYFLISLSVISFFLGFIYGENSAGAGTLAGDFQHHWKNLQTFVNNDLGTAIKFTSETDPSKAHENYQSSRTPLIYILQKYLNPFVYDKILYIKSVFVISFLGPLIFYFCLKQKFKKEDNLLLLLITSFLFLSPFYRTSSYWGLEENYGIISLLLAFLFLNLFLERKNQEDFKGYLQLFFSILFSSACIYFDQKLLIIPIICFFKIFFSNINIKIKIFTTVVYFIFSLPFIYLIYIWGSIIPPADTIGRGLGSDLYFEHIGYSCTIIAFYLVPLFFYKKENIFDTLKTFFKNKNNQYLISLFFIYLVYLLFYHNFEGERTLGKGFISKISMFIFEGGALQKVFIYFSFFISWLIILIYFNNNLKDKLIILYFFLLTTVTWPVLQEYYDPLVILLSFTFFSSKIFLNYKSSIFLFFYLFIFLISSNIYYYNLFN